jgi:hypothetical protein
VKAQDDWPELSKEAGDLSREIEEELKKEQIIKRYSGLKKLLTRALWLISILWRLHGCDMNELE